MKKITKRGLQLDRETVRLLAGRELREVFGGLPPNTDGDGCPTTVTVPTCEGASCAITECGVCYTARKKPCL